MLVCGVVWVLGFGRFFILCGVCWCGFVVLFGSLGVFVGVWLGLVVFRCVCVYVCGFVFWVVGLGSVG